MNEFLQKINNFALLLFVFGVNFEYWDPFGLQGVFSISKMAAIIYIASWVPKIKQISFKQVNYFLIPLIFYLLMEFFSSSINNIYVSSILGTFNFKLAQLLLILVLIVNHLYNSPRMLNFVLHAFIINILLLSILSIFGIGISYDDNATLREGRLTMFGENPNIIGLKASLALIMVFYYFFEVKLKLKIILVVVMLPLLSMLIATASRGALLAMFFGLAILLLIQQLTLVKKVVLLGLGIIFSVWLFNYIMKSNELFASRMNVFIEEGNTGRNDLWDGAIQIIRDNLIIGVGRQGALPVMQQYIGRAMDPHNVFLYVLMTTGIIGFTFFMTFIIRLMYRLYLKFKIDKNPLFLVLFAILLFNMSKAGGFIDKTFLWFLSAILIGASLHSYNSKSNENFIRNRSLSNKHSPQ